MAPPDTQMAGWTRPSLIHRSPWPARGSAPEDAFEELSHLVVLLLALDVGLALHPGDLDHAPLAREWQVAVPGMVGAQECEHRAHGRRHFELVAVVVLVVIENPEATPLVLLPRVIHVDEHGHDLGRAVRVDGAVFRLRPPHDSGQARILMKVHAEFL